MPNTTHENTGQPGCAKSAELLPFYLNQSLEKEEARQLEAHLASCPACREDERDTRTAQALYEGHLPVELLLDYALEAPLSPRRRAVIESHLKTCRQCSEELAAVRLEEPTPTASGQATVEPASRRSPTPANRWRNLAWAASLAAAVASGGWLWTFQQLVDERTSATTIRANPSVVELLPASRSLLRNRNADPKTPPNRVELSEGARELVLVLLSGGRSCPAGCSLELYGTEQDSPTSRIDALTASPDGHLTVALPADWLPHGRSRVVVREPASGEPVAEYLIETTPSG